MKNTSLRIARFDALRTLALLLIVVTLSGCYPYRRVGLLQDRDDLPQYPKGEFYEYKLRANDEIEIRVVTSNEPTALLFSNNGRTQSSRNTTYTYRIHEDGTVDLPFLPKVKIEGMTLSEAEKHIESLMSDYADDIKVRLALATGTFCVIGDAGRGYFPIYKERLTIFQALALARGLNVSADFRHVKVLRVVDGKAKILDFDVRSSSIVDSEYYYIYPNDVIYVDTSKRRFWAIESASGFVSTISSSISMIILLYNQLKK